MNQEEVTSRTKLELRERDFQILLGIEKWGVLGVGQINGLVQEKEITGEEKVRQYFNETLRKDYWTRIYKRAEQLRKAGYLGADHEPRTYLLTEKGHEALKAKGRARGAGFRGGISAHLVEHELRVAGVGLLLEKLLGREARAVRERTAATRGGWRPSTRRGIPDLWVSGEPAKAIEVELHAKGQLEYQAIWSAYRLKLRGKGIVLYLTAMPEGVRTILGYARRFEADFVYVCDLKEFRDSLGRAAFLGCRDGQRVVIERRPAAPSFKIAPPPPPQAAAAVHAAHGGFAA